MASMVDASAQAIAEALAPSPSAPAARWRWGTVVSVGNSGTMNVSIGGATVAGIRCAQHVMGAQVGDRVRVLYCGTEAIVDAVRATSSQAYGGDLDLLVHGGVYYISTAATNTPESGVFGLLAVSSTSTASTVVQTFVTRNGTVYTRYRSSGAWVSWADINGVTTTSTASSIISEETGFTVASANYAVSGKTAMLRLTVGGFAASTGSQAVGNIVAGKIPVMEVYGGSTSRYVTYARINSSGEFTVYWNTAPSTSTNYTFQFTYLIP